MPEPRKVVLSMYLTLDGYNEFPSYPGSEPPATEPDQVAQAMWVERWKGFDTLLFDRETYEQWADFWPLEKRAPGEHPWFRTMSEFAETAKKVVLSENKGPATWAHTRWLGGSLEGALDTLRKEAGKSIVVVAPGLGAELMRQGRIDEYLFAISPAILGRGRAFFVPMEGQQTLRLVEVRRFPAGELFLHYETVR